MTSIPHSRFVDAHADWVTERIDDLTSDDRRPLVVPLTVTFDPKSIRANGVLREFERLYVRVCRLLMCNPDRPSKRPLLPFTLAYRDDPSTRWKGDRPTFFADHPQVAPHVHALMIVHPSLTDRFLAIAGSLEATWRSISPRTNRTLLADLRRATEIDALMMKYPARRDEVRSIIRGWIGYSSKLRRRWDVPDDDDTFTVLPTCRATRSTRHHRSRRRTNRAQRGTLFTRSQSSAGSSPSPLRAGGCARRSARSAPRWYRRSSRG
jgi:hypothetical protein